MIQYLLKEKELLEVTDYNFTISDRKSFKWFSMKSGEITEHLHLIHAMAENPQCLIFRRNDTVIANKFLTIYFDSDLQVISYLPFNNWRLHDNISSFGKYKYFNLEDPKGIKKSVALTEYYPYLPLHLKPYIICRSFEEYESMERSK